VALALRFAARSDVGLLRDGNEDAAYAGPRLLVVADGMGGHAAGEVASSVAVATVAALDEDSPGPDLLDRLAAAVQAANAHLREMVDGDPALGGMGTTLTALLRAGPRFGLVHVGDSRCYLLRDGELQQVTHDHTFVQSLVDEGRITPEQADHHPQRSLLTNALDGRGSVDLDLSIREARAGDRWLLCTDGLSGVVSEDTIRDTLMRGGPDTAADALVELALRGGGPDNVTCIVADVVEVASAPSDIPQVVGAAGSGPARSRSGDGTAGAPPSAAARAAALAGTDRDAQQRAEEARRRDADEAQATQGNRRWPRRILAVATLIALVAVGGLAAYAWSREQFYVGPYEQRVAIYRGLSQNVLGWSPSSLYAAQDIPLDALSDWSRRRVEANISASGLADARRIVSRLGEEAAACERLAAQPAGPTPEPTAGPPGPTPGPTPGATAGPTPGATLAATPAPGAAAPTRPPTPPPTAAPTPTATTGSRACPGAA
jgi:PPM family protein phosphatase